MLKALYLVVGIEVVLLVHPEVDGIGFHLVMVVIEHPKFPSLVGAIEEPVLLIISNVQQVHYRLALHVVLLSHCWPLGTILPVNQALILFFIRFHSNILPASTSRYNRRTTLFLPSFTLHSFLLRSFTFTPQDSFYNYSFV